ncbi:carbohydrate kinase family protein [Parafrigoribacterium soli]|uniref:carbohydrate kinase family protein n=1 Tax=Parafrigoribacterium soli TaxID=3144663 RepID=UPI0032EE97D5
MSGRRIVVFGDVIDDIVVVPSGPVRVDTDTPSSIRHRPGGSAANAAAWLGVAGAGVDFVGLVGEGDVERTAHLAAHPSLPTGAIVVLVDGQNRSMLTERGANAALGPDDVTDALLDTAAFVHFSGYSVFASADPQSFRRLIDRATFRGVAVSVDPGSAGFIADYGADRFLDVIAGAAILFPNLEEGRVLTGHHEPEEVASALSERFDVVALTLGETGVMVAERDRDCRYTRASTVEIVDPTGAGDAFSAGFLASWLGSRDLQRAADAGVALAARAVAITGGRPAY